MRKAELIRQLEQLRQNLREEDTEDQLLARARLLTLLLTMRHTVLGHAVSAGQRAEAGPGNKRRRALMLQARRYLAEHYSGPVCLEDIAHALNISTYYLSHVFSEENDFSLFTYLTTLRMERARELLQAGRLNVSEVARAVGYENSNYFSKVFRKHFARPPTITFPLPRRLLKQGNNSRYSPAMPPCFRSPVAVRPELGDYGVRRA